MDTHLTYLHAAASLHRAAGRALSQRPDHPDLLRQRQSPIAVSAAHRARGASFGQRAEFVEQLLNFPTSGLHALGPSDMRTLQVPAHIGAVALPEDVAQAIAERESTSRLRTAQPSVRPAEPTAASPENTQNQHDDAAPFAPTPPKEKKKKWGWGRRSFEDILRGHK